MGDMADDFRALRETKQALRRHWHECPTCRERYGTGTKVPPGRKCRNCRWVAPGQVGDDEIAAFGKAKPRVRHMRPKPSEADNEH